MAAKTPNPHAFPNAGAPYHADGMSLRDYFAGIALPIIMQQDEWLVSTAGKKQRRVITDADLAASAYQLADAMLKARAKRSTKSAFKEYLNTVAS